MPMPPAPTWTIHLSLHGGKVIQQQTRRKHLRQQDVEYLIQRALNSHEYQLAKGSLLISKDTGQVIAQVYITLTHPLGYEQQPRITNPLTS